MSRTKAVSLWFHYLQGQFIPYKKKEDRCRDREGALIEIKHTLVVGT